jgi:FdhE protein
VRGPCRFGSEGSLSYRTIRHAWPELLKRRAAFRDVLAAYEPILEAWAAGAETSAAPLAWTADECQARWRAGLPLLAEAPLAIGPEALEDLLAAPLELLARAGEASEPLERLAAAWDRGELTPAALFPARGRLGAPNVSLLTGLSPEAVGFVAYTSLRPILEPYFAGCRAHVGVGGWDLGVCPLCGAPPGFGAVGEDGQRQLACHCCGGSWPFARLACPYCGSREARDLVRLQGEEREEGYVIAACRSCRGYLKEVDRRLRFDTGPALVEDWGSPHLDVFARRQEYWRAVPTLIDVSGPAEESSA